MLGEAKFFKFLFYMNERIFFKKTTCLPLLSVGKQNQLSTPTDGMGKMSDFDKLDEKTETELQAAAFRRLRGCPSSQLAHRLLAPALIAFWREGVPGGVRRVACGSGRESWDACIKLAA